MWPPRLWVRPAERVQVQPILRRVRQIVRLRVIRPLFRVASGGETGEDDENNGACPEQHPFTRVHVDQGPILAAPSGVRSCRRAHWDILALLMSDPSNRDDRVRRGAPQAGSLVRLDPPRCGRIETGIPIYPAATSAAGGPSTLYSLETYS